MAEARGRGRPTDYRLEFCDRVIELGKQGLSVAEMAADVGVAKFTLLRWEAAHEEFRDAMAIARTLAQAWWEEKGRSHIVNEPNGPSLNSSLYSRSMAARFPDDWRENSRIEHAGDKDNPLQVLFSELQGTALRPATTDDAG